MWTATMTRPDIAFAIRAGARFVQNPGLAHKKAMMKILQYLLHTKEWGITYDGQGCGLCSSHRWFLRHPSAVLALIFISRRIQPFLSLVNQKV